MKTTLTILAHGESGVGKSWFADTAPAPRLVLDAEGRAKYTPSQPKTLWDPRASGPPAYDGTWETCVVPVTEYSVIDLAYQWLRSNQHPFVSVIVDSIMEVQKRLRDSVVGIQDMDQQDWNKILIKLESTVRQYRDLTMFEQNPVSVVALVVGSRASEKGRMEPMLQGQMRDLIAYYLDVVGYLYKAPQPDGTFARSLLVEQQPGFVAKDNTGKLPGPIIADPNIAQMLEYLHVNGKRETIAQEGVVAA